MKLQQHVNKYIWSFTTYIITEPSIKKQGLYIPRLIDPDKPWEFISMEYMSRLPSTKYGNDCIFLVFDHFSKMVDMTT